MQNRTAWPSLLLSIGLAATLIGLVRLVVLAAPGNPILTPAPNTHTALPTTTISITYAESISAATVTSRTVAVQGMQSGLVTAAHTVSGSVIHVDPVGAFYPGELVQASATTGTLNLAGEEPLAPTVWQFRTAVGGGTGRFGPEEHDKFGTSYGLAVDLGDLDGDGDLDAVVVHYWEAAAWFNDGDGTYSSFTTFGGARGWDAVLGDVDGDSDLDILLAYRDGSPQEVWLNDGTGIFPISTTFGSGDSRGAALGDLDGDGDLDAAVVNRGEPHVAFLNDGSGSYPISTTFGGGDSHDVALGDVDTDGDLDVVVANGSQQAQEVWLNDGSGTFPISTTFGAGRTQAVALGDVDGDGDLDAILASNSGDPQEAWFNDGSGTFITTTTFGAGTSRGIALGDLDADDDLDAVVANYDAQAQDVWLNDGSGSYPISTTFGADYSWDVALGDVDGDGDLDAVVANEGVRQEAWLNRDRIYVDADATTGADNGSSWADAYVHLQDALDEIDVYSGTVFREVWVAEGVYYPDLDADGDHVDDVVSETFTLRYDGIQLYGGFDPQSGADEWSERDGESYPTVLSGDLDGNDPVDAHGVVTDAEQITGTNAYHVVWIDGTSEPISTTTVVDGFTITGGYGVGSGTETGGGLYCDGSDGGECSPTLSYLTFSGNAAVLGGGMANVSTLGGKSNPALTDVLFSGNLAEIGGGMTNGGFEGGMSSPALTDVIFRGNRAAVGGGMVNYGSLGGTSSPTMTNVLFSGNGAWMGGGMANVANTANLGTTVSPLLMNVTFSGNQADEYGGAMYNQGEALSFESNCTPGLANVILWGNAALSGTVMYNDDAEAFVVYSLIEGGCDGSGITNVNGGDAFCMETIINADPAFMRDPDPGDGDWFTLGDNDYGDLRLGPTSPAIDAGDNDALVELVPHVVTDLAGNPRFVDVPTVVDTGDGTPPIVDMGAYEMGWEPVYLPLVLKNS